MRQRRAGIAAAPARTARAPSSSTRAPAAAKRIERNIDAVEVAVVGATVLDVVVDLQGRAQRVVGRPGRARLAMDVEHEAADRHRRIAAIFDQLVPVAVAQLGHVHAERREQVLGVARRQLALLERGAQPPRRGFAVGAAEKAGFERVEMGELLGRARASDDRRCRRRCGRSRRRPGSDRDAAALISSEATGKFSSRWPLPDRSSAAPVISPSPPGSGPSTSRPCRASTAIAESMVKTR